MYSHVLMKLRSKTKAMEVTRIASATQHLSKA